ncbi:hypothetical protein KC332_g3528 [Hortaea werneckii]|uniref:Chitin-binding type-1 domain-containing protein n=2 Tax=Hortaea werneckii TaxID=91943 RepID=A0A3M7JAB9_HORWE|nr:hypothetical protein KC358_g3542 [Hortaea werneckii]OTA35544.1 hypothetical protein BTJ68_04911 [Hortaea werneckii EXF-2000]KAI6845853.1 hypothetical protein KC350_g4202 [Hortaea werneckii]KAI6925423.1 hypothetical protein KC348_g8969 [Hortaea werneckii]KAI6939728.1 hypothetical protein KC341_g3964 [Hortaea werneckii]
MRTFTVAVTALLAVLSVTFAKGDDDSVHSLAIPVSHSGMYLVAPTQPVPISLSTVSEPAKAFGLATTAKTLAATSGGVMLRRSGDKLFCDCGPGYCCLESGEKIRCLELAAGICPSPFDPAAGSVPKGTGNVVTIPTTTSTLPMESLDHISTQSTPIENMGSTSQRLPVAKSDALGKGDSATFVTSSSLHDKPIETYVTVSTLTEPTCDDDGCCTFSPSWTACQGGYLTQLNEDVLSSTQTPSSEPLNERPSQAQTTSGLDDNRDVAPILPSSTSRDQGWETFVVVQPVLILDQEVETDRERLDFNTMTPIRPFPTPSHYRISLDGHCGPVVDTTCDGSLFGYCCGPDNTCGDDKDYCAPENCNPSVLCGRCWSPAWNTSANDHSDHRRRDNPVMGNSSAAVVTTVLETVTVSQSVVYVYDTFTSSKEESSKSIAQGTSGAPTSSAEVSFVDHSGAHDDFSISTTNFPATTVVVTASETLSSSVLASMSTTTSTTTITNSITLTNPLYPAATTVVPANYTHPNISNTSINTGIFVNISTFSATGLTIASTGGLSTEASTTLETGLVNSETSISSKVIRPSATETEPFNNGPQDFSPAATTNIGGQNHSSEGVKTTGGDCTFYVIAAVLGLADIGGLMLLL